MATYLSVVNEVLGELNEVRLTAANFSAAVNIQQVVKEVVNRAYRDIHDEEYKWPWMSVGSSLDNFSGNTYVETSNGVMWAKLKPTATSLEDTFGNVDWESFILTTKGVTGEVAPFTIKKLSYKSMEEWLDSSSIPSSLNGDGTVSTGVPSNVIRHPDGMSFGLSPIPDKVYRVYFYAWNQLADLSAHSDTLVIPSQYLQVLVARARYYVWMFKDQMQRSQAALEDYKKGLKRMREALNPASIYMKTDQVRYV